MQVEVEVEVRLGLGLDLSYVRLGWVNIFMLPVRRLKDRSKFHSSRANRSGRGGPPK